jgi:hypothetical protein
MLCSLSLFATGDSTGRPLYLVPKADLLMPTLGLIHKAGVYSFSIEKKIFRRCSVELSFLNFYSTNSSKTYITSSSSTASQQWYMVDFRWYHNRTIIEHETNDTISATDTTDAQVHTLINEECRILKPLRWWYLAPYFKYITNYSKAAANSLISADASSLEYKDRALALGCMLGLQAVVKNALVLDFHFGFGMRYYYTLHMINLSNVSFSRNPWEYDSIINLNIGYMF